MKFETKAIWVGQEADAETGASIIPINDLIGDLNNALKKPKL